MRFFAGGLRLRVTTLTALLSFLCASIGVVPTSEWLVRLGVQISGERFPCEGGRCGCSSARECWTMCLCQSLAEKIAWSEREGVAVPEYVDESLAGAPKESAPACPLCTLHTDSAPTPARHGPDLSPIGCKGLNMLAVAGVVLGVRESLVACAPMEVGAERVWAPGARAPAFVALDVPSPPPRA